MHRRRLLYGLGLATVGSSATALTGATLSNTVSPTADFRVNVDAGLLVEAGYFFRRQTTTGEQTISQGETQAGQTGNFYKDTDGNYVYFTHDSTFSFQGTDSEFRAGIQSVKQTAYETTGDGNYPEFIVNDIDAINGALQFAATIPYAKGRYAVYFRDAIKVTNQTGGRTDIGITFEDGGNSGYGTDVGANGVLTKNQVQELIQIKATLAPTFTTPLGDKIYSRSKISPAAPNESTSSSAYTLDQGDTAHLHVGFDIPYSDTTGLQDALEAHTTDPANDDTTLDFLDTLYIGVMSP